MQQDILNKEVYVEYIFDHAAGYLESVFVCPIPLLLPKTIAIVWIIT